MTGLQEARWVTDGEILNLDRHILTPDKFEKKVESLKYLRREAAPEIFHRAISFLNDCTTSKGFIYKDVTHPFILADWPGLKKLTPIYLHRPLTDVAYSVIKRSWTWPAHAITRKEIGRSHILQGLIAAQDCLMNIPARRLNFDEIIYRPDVLNELLIDYPLTSVNLLTDEFCQHRDHILSIRKTSEYSDLDDEITSLKSNLL